MIWIFLLSSVMLMKAFHYTGGWRPLEPGLKGVDAGPKNAGMCVILKTPHCCVSFLDMAH